MHVHADLCAKCTTPHYPYKCEGLWAITDLLSIYTPLDLASNVRNYPAFSPSKTLSPSSTFYSCPLAAGNACSEQSGVKLEAVSYTEQMVMTGSTWSTSPKWKQYASKLGFPTTKLQDDGTGALLEGAGFTFQAGLTHETNPVYKATLPDTGGVVLYLAWYKTPVKVTGLAISSAGHWVIGVDDGTTVAASTSGGEDKVTLKMVPVLFLEDAEAQPPDGGTNGKSWFYFTLDGAGTLVKTNDGNAVFTAASFSTVVTTAEKTTVKTTTTKTTTTPYIGPPTTRTTTTTILTTAITTAATTFTQTVTETTTTTPPACPNAPEPCCTILGVKGKGGYNTQINGHYNYVGLFEGRPAFNRPGGDGDFGDMSVWWAPCDTTKCDHRWMISDGIGSMLMYGYWEEDVANGPFETTEPPILYGATGYVVDEGVKSWCVAGLGTTTSTSSTSSSSTATRTTATTTTPYTGPPTTRTSTTLTTSTVTTVTTTTNDVGKCGSDGGQTHGWCDRSCDVCADNGDPTAVPFVSDHICIWAPCGRTTTAYRRSTTPDPRAGLAVNITGTDGSASGKNGLSGAGVAMVVIAVLALIAGPFIYLYWKKTKRKTAMPLSKTLAMAAKKERPVSMFGGGTSTSTNPTFERPVTGLQRPLSSYATPTTPGFSPGATPGGRPMSMLEALGGGRAVSSGGVSPMAGGARPLSMLEAISGNSDGKRADVGRPLSLVPGALAPVPVKRGRPSPFSLGNQEAVPTPTGWHSTPGSSTALLEEVAEEGPHVVTAGWGTPSSTGVHITPTFANGKRYSIPMESGGLFDAAFSARLGQQAAPPRTSPLRQSQLAALPRTSPLRQSQGPGSSNI